MAKQLIFDGEVIGQTLVAQWYEVQGPWLDWAKTCVRGESFTVPAETILHLVDFRQKRVSYRTLNPRTQMHVVNSRLETFREYNVSRLVEVAAGAEGHVLRDGTFFVPNVTIKEPARPERMLIGQLTYLGQGRVKLRFYT